MQMPYSAKQCLTVVLVGLVWWTAGGVHPLRAQDESSEAAIAKYADAANFQTNGAMELAVEAWQEFLDQYPEDPLAPKAAHYLGVCLMQKEPADYRAAAEAFARALKHSEYDLREESLANRGWCLYAASGEGVDPGQRRDAELLEATIATFKRLAQEFPKSEFLDQAYFFSGEAAYGLGNARRAIVFYDSLLRLPKASESPLRCDALYARGVAQEELKAYDDAIRSYQRLLDDCGQDDASLAQEVRVRMGDLLILQQKNDAAAEVLAKAADEGGENAAYARFRQAFALAQANRSAQAAEVYEQVIAQHPDSRYAAAAILASAQSSYIAGDIDTARRRFEQVLAGDSLAESTEAAHWLVQIALREDDAAAAERIAAAQLQRGAEGPYALNLKLDRAEAMSLIPEKAAESLDLFAAVYREDPSSPLAPRALYNAAFAALQSGKLQRAVDLAGEFLKRFAQDPLAPDVRYIDAEAKLLAGRHADSAAAYQRLLDSAADNPQRSVWALRGITAAYLARQYDQAIQLAEAQQASLDTDLQRAEASFLIGASQLFSDAPEQAIAALQSSRQLAPQWTKGDEALLLLGQAQQAAGDSDAAEATWRQLIEQYPQRRMADQALFRIGQQAAGNEDYDAAVAAYSKILQRDNDPGLIPYALYNKGWSLLQQDKPDEARPLLKRMLDQYEQHPLREQTQLAYGVTLRKMEQMDPAEQQLREIIDGNAEGNALGHALYELAQLELQRERPAQAAEVLQRLVQQVPDYDAMERVLYDLAWALKESGKRDQAVEYFEQLIERYPEHPLAAEANYFIAEQHYAAEDWQAAANFFGRAAALTEDPELAEKGLYNQGWSLYRIPDYEAAEAVFRQQASEHPQGNLVLDALLMTGESRFKLDRYEAAMEYFRAARQRIEAADENADKITDPDQQQIRELVYLHGGQSLGQLEQWEQSIQWLDALRERFPNSDYLPQVFFQTAYAHQQLGQEERALQLYAQVAGKYRDETAARSRFMMGEVYFGRRELAKAIPEFQRVMYGFGAEKAPPGIKNWQAKSGYEAGRCAELLIQSTSGSRRENAIKYARQFFGYVVEKHPQHELAPKAQERLQVLRRL
ncbi:tetratricopeptide repeat protein [Roseimaritima sediminicola]|uniref:tetratricopeptide repeat protein n=1 Tax=Roseimaritima sediminicola TaxID=2662066 RepID=UPI0013872D81|nr:tetratricopeptide repeat protein [Roseimaritima sediminicola]